MPANVTLDAIVLAVHKVCDSNGYRSRVQTTEKDSRNYRGSKRVMLSVRGRGVDGVVDLMFAGRGFLYHVNLNVSRSPFSCRAEKDAVLLREQISTAINKLCAI